MKIVKHNPAIPVYLKRMIILGPLVVPYSYFTEAVAIFTEDGAHAEASRGVPYMKSGTVLLHTQTNHMPDGSAQACCSMGQTFGIMVDLKAIEPIPPEHLATMDPKLALSLVQAPFVGAPRLPKPKKRIADSIESMLEKMNPGRTSGPKEEPLVGNLIPKRTDTFWVYTEGKKSWLATGLVRTSVKSEVDGYGLKDLISSGDMETKALIWEVAPKGKRSPNKSPRRPDGG